MGLGVSDFGFRGLGVIELGLRFRLQGFRVATAVELKRDFALHDAMRSCVSEHREPLKGSDSFDIKPLVVGSSGNFPCPEVEQFCHRLPRSPCA